MSEEKLELGEYDGKNGLDLYCANCGDSFEETLSGHYSPVQYESEKHNRECATCLRQLGYEI